MKISRPDRSGGPQWSHSAKANQQGGKVSQAALGAIKKTSGTSSNWLGNHKVTKSGPLLGRTVRW